MIQKNLISLIIPLFNEEKTFPYLRDCLQKEFLILEKEYAIECIIVDDGSTDSTWMLISKLHQQDTRFCGIRFTKNFGHQIALTAGYDIAQGDVVISLDGDLQHPPETIHRMLACWKDGAKVVYARRKSCKEGIIKKSFSLIYYKILNAAAGDVFPEGVSDFRLLDREVLNALKRCRERFRYLRGAVAQLGFPYKIITYEQPIRVAGSSKYSFKKMFQLGFNGLICFSKLPLRLAFYCGLFVLASGSITMPYVFIRFLSSGSSLAALGVGIMILYMLLGMIFIMVWMLGEYISHIYELQKEPIPYVILETRMSIYEKNDLIYHSGLQRTKQSSSVI